MPFAADIPWFSGSANHRGDPDVDLAVVGLAGVAEQGCRSDRLDVRGKCPTDGVLTEPGKPGQPC
jgi:hypothetical protein